MITGWSPVDKFREWDCHDNPYAKGGRRQDQTPQLVVVSVEDKEKVEEEAIGTTSTTVIMTATIAMTEMMAKIHTIETRVAIDGPRDRMIDQGRRQDGTALLTAMIVSATIETVNEMSSI